MSYFVIILPKGGEIIEITTHYLDDRSCDSRTELEIEEIDTCPLCNYAINPREYSSVITLEPRILGNTEDILHILNVLFLCPKCKKSFLAKYTVTFIPPNPFSSNVSGHYTTTLIDVFPKSPKVIQLDAVIKSISPKFVQIYNESLHAETLGLFEVAGPGYRKAFEFLIKDYLIKNSKTNEDEEKIKKLSLMQCINILESPQLKEVAKRAAWLGNDQTHYIPLFEEYDLTHLKSMINIAISWITLLIETHKSMQIEPRK